MTKKVLKDSFLWGFLLWLFGYVLGIVLFPFLPPSLLGWVIMPIGILLTIWILVKKIHLQFLSQYVILGLIWVLIAVVCDYFLLVKVFNPADGYYKLDVYVYYILTFVVPLTVGWWKTARK